MVQPLVSVLIPMFNAERFITDTLASLERQSYSNLEIIVVDDGSTDSSAALVEEWSDPRLTLVRQANAGQPAALNNALRHCHGEYVQYIDADDQISSNKIDLQVERLMATPNCIASSEWGRFKHDIAEAQFIPEPVWADLQPLDWLAKSRSQGGGMLFPALWLIPRSIITYVGDWREETGNAQTPETEYFTKVILASDGVLFCRGAKCYYRSGIPGSVSSRKNLDSWASQFKVISYCEKAVLQYEYSDRIRRGFALSWQIFAHGCYPYQPELADQALQRAKTLHAVETVPDGGSAFRLASRLLGWRLARRLQVLTGRP